MRIALVSREVFPFGGGGIGVFVNAAAHLLSRIADVTVLTSAAHEGELERLRAAGDPRLPDVRWGLVPEPAGAETAGWFSWMHCWSARVYERLQELYPEGGPDLVEFGDYLGEGFVTVQAADAEEPFLRDTLVAVRVHTSGEMCAVLDGEIRHDFPTEATHTMERFALAHADRLIWQGGDIYGTYERFYRGHVAPGARIRYPFRGVSGSPGADARYALDGPLRLLYAGRLERRKGVHQLARAVTALPGDDWSLTFVGGDTPTGPLGTSMRDVVGLAGEGDPRVELRDPVPRERLAALVAEHDVVVLPSLWECWPYAALEALHLNRPVLASPTGGFTEMIRPGAGGWLTRGTGVDDVEAALRRLLDQREEVAELIRTDAPLRLAAELTDEDDIARGYEALLAEPRPRRRRAPARPARPPLVSAVVPYFRTHRFVCDTVESLLAQTHPRMEIIVVNDGSWTEEDEVLAELSARLPVTVLHQPNAGLGAARNFGIRQCRGRYVLPLDSDNMVEPGFVARCLGLLEARDDLDFVTTWSRYVDEDGLPRAGRIDVGYQPFGNVGAANAESNVSGDAAALLRRRLFEEEGFAYSEELTSYEDWHLYRELQRAGRRGAVVPGRLLRYRVRPDSMTNEIAIVNRERILAEIDARLRESEVAWTSSSA